MRKPANLRAAIEAALPDLKGNPDRLLVFIDEGTLRCTAAASLSFEYGYTLKVIVTDYAQHADTIIVPLLAWIATNQPELLANPDRQRDGIRFEADLLDKGKMDLALSIQLTERVVVRLVEGGGYTAEHVPEPPLDEWAGWTWNLTIRHPDGTEEAVG